MADVHQSGMIASMQKLFESSKYSDLAIRCGTSEYKVHRAVLCLRSKFFAAACDRDFIEAKTSTIDLKGDDPASVERMLTYLYTLDYDDKGDPALMSYYMPDDDWPAHLQASAVAEQQLSEDDMASHQGLMNNVAVYAIADKYDILGLKELAKTKLRAIIWPEGLLWLTPTAVNAIFRSTPATEDGLRDIAIQNCTLFVRSIINDDSQNGMLKDHGQLGLGVIRNLLSARDTDVSYLEAKLRMTEKELLGRLSDLRDELELVSTVINSLAIPSQGSNSQVFHLANFSLDTVKLKIKEIKESINTQR